MYEEADGPWQMRGAVRANLRRGADFVKIMATGARSVEREDPEPAQLTREELAAVVDEAHRLGVRVAAHAEGLDGARLAIEEGVDTIEHGQSLTGLLSCSIDGLGRSGARADPDDVPRPCGAVCGRMGAVVSSIRRGASSMTAYRTLEAAQAAGVTMAMGFDSGPPRQSCGSWCGWPKAVWERSTHSRRRLPEERPRSATLRSVD